MKDLHQFFAILTIGGFVIRAHWAMRSSPILQHRITRIAPHVVDTLFLATGVVLVLQMRLPVLQTEWLLAKFAGLVAYIVLGALTLRPGRSERARLLAFTGALLAFAYVVNTAISKSALPWSG